MYYRIEVKHKENLTDGRELRLLDVIKEDVGINLTGLTIVDVYNIFGEYSENEICVLKESLFCDHVYQDARIGFYYAANTEYDYCVEVSYKPGVTDNVGRTACEGIGHLLKRKVNPEDVRSSFLYLLKGSIDKATCEKISRKVLCNELIETFVIYNREEILGGKIITYEKPVTHQIKPPYSKEIDLEVGDDILMKISDDGVLSLSLEEMKAIRDYYRRDDIKSYRKSKKLPQGPTDVELEVFAQTWSEHCKHKIFAANIHYKADDAEKKIKSLFKTYIKGATDEIGKKRSDLLSLFVDNAGVVKFNDDYAYCVKVETHNSPSALDPYGGAMTGIVGVNRDILGTGLGAQPIFNTDIFCFGSPFTTEEDVLPGLLHPRRIFRGVHRGIKDGGNESGIPTVNGSIVFDESFLGKPLVFCGTGGLMPIKTAGKNSYEKYVEAGDLIVMCGGRIGKDGIHGATFSSAHLTEASPTSAVQIGDPITQKKMIDFILEARDLGLFSGLTDNGAGGLSSSIGEMAEFTNGARLELEKCPLKYQGLMPWEILLSEAQERMSIAVPADKIDAFLKLSAKRDVESTVIGEFNNSGYFECTYNGEVICSIDLDMLHDGTPAMNLNAVWDAPAQKRMDVVNADYKDSLRKILQSPNVASKEFWVRMYDHEVQARTVGKPFCGKDNDGPADGAVLKLFPDSNEGLVVTHGIVPRYSELDSYQMAANAIDEAYRSAVLLGANPDKMVGLDNFCWPDPVEGEHTPDGAYKLAQLVRACEAVYDVTVAYNCPCISGKDSMKNDYRGQDKKISILPTLLFTVVGKIDDITTMTSHYFKDEGDLIYVLGKTEAELGAGEYYSLHKVNGGMVPKVDHTSAMELYRKTHTAISKKLIRSAHDLSDGGLAVCLAEKAFSGKLGAVVDLDVLGSELTVEEKLFSESASRIMVTVAPDKEAEFLSVMNGEAVYCIGKTVTKDTVKISADGKVVLEDNIDELKSIWKNALVF